MHEKAFKRNSKTLYMKTPPDENSEKPLCDVRIKNSCYINSDYSTLYKGIPGTAFSFGLHILTHLIAFNYGCKSISQYEQCVIVNLKANYLSCA